MFTAFAHTQEVETPRAEMHRSVGAEGQKRKRTTIVCSDDEGDEEVLHAPPPLHSSISGDFSKTAISSSSVPLADRENALPAKLQESLDRMESKELAPSEKAEDGWLDARTVKVMTSAERQQNIQIAKKERLVKKGAPNSGTLLLQEVRAEAEKRTAEKEFFRYTKMRLPPTSRDLSVAPWPLLKCAKYILRYPNATFTYFLKERAQRFEFFYTNPCRGSG